jgi:hypothetical protein
VESGSECSTFGAVATKVTSCAEHPVQNNKTTQHNTVTMQKTLQTCKTDKSRARDVSCPLTDQTSQLHHNRGNPHMRKHAYACTLQPPALVQLTTAQCTSKVCRYQRMYPCRCKGSQQELCIPANCTSLAALKHTKTLSKLQPTCLNELPATLNTSNTRHEGAVFATQRDVQQPSKLTELPSTHLH